MSQTRFNHLSLISSLLAGYSFTFLGSLLTSTAQSRAYAWVFVSVLLAALSLMVAAVSSVFAGIAVQGVSVADPRLESLHQLKSQAFLVGTVCLVLAAGASGWLRSQRLGVL